MVQSADTRQWEQQVRIPVVPTADLTKSSTQSGAGFINCTFYDVEDSFGKRIFVNKRPGFQSTGTTSATGVYGHTTYGTYLDQTGKLIMNSDGSCSNNFSQSFSVPETVKPYSWKSSDIVLVRNGSVELKAVLGYFNPLYSYRYRIHEFEIPLVLKTSGPYNARTFITENTDFTTFSSLSSGSSNMYPIGIVCYDMVSISGSFNPYNVYMWVALTGGYSYNDVLVGDKGSVVIGGATWTAKTVATYATYTAGSTIVADSLGNQWLYLGMVQSSINNLTDGSYGGWTPQGDGAFLNGYLFWCDTKGNVRNSILNYPMAFSSSGYIQPASGEKLVTTARVNNSLLVFSNKKTYFYSVGSAGNSGYQGSPLQPMQQATKDIGCAYSNSVASAEGMVALVATASNGTKTVVAYNNTNYQEIGNDDLTTILGDSTSYSDIHAWFIRTTKGLMYIMQLLASDGSVNKTFSYSFDNGVWGQWDSTNGLSTIAFRPQSKSKNYYSGTNEYFIDTSGNTYSMTDDPRDKVDSTYYNYTMQIRTPKLDFGTTRYKFMNWISIATEQRTYNADTGQMNIRVGFEDDNGVVTYLSSTPNPTYDGNWLRWTRCGRFRRRRIVIDNSDQYCPVFSNVDIGYTLGER